MTDEVAKNKKKKIIKIVIRRLPPYMTWNELKVQLDPIPPTEYISFVAADLSFEPNAFCRCYLAFSSDEDVMDFSERFNRYVFVDSKGYESAAIVELSLFGKLPKTSPQDAAKDNYCGLVQDEFEYKQFLDELENNRKCNYLSLEEQIRAVNAKDDKSKTGINQQTPLTLYMFKKNEEKAKKKEERRRTKGEERKRVKEKTEEEKKKKTQDVPSTVRSEAVRTKMTLTQRSTFPSKSTYSRDGGHADDTSSAPRTTFASKSSYSRDGGHADDASSSYRPTEKVKEKPFPKKKESKPKEKSNTSSSTNKEPRNSNRNALAAKSTDENKEKTYRYPTKTFTPSRITALSKDPSEKKKNKDRPDREIYKPGQRLRDTEGTHQH